jgi:hypothetical protein
MTEATEFRLYAKEALRESAKATSREEKRALSDLACIWARAAEVSERLFKAPATPWADPGASVKGYQYAALHAGLKP